MVVSIRPARLVRFSEVVLFSEGPLQEVLLELFGVEYHRQSGTVLNTKGEELDHQIDEGFEDIDDQEYLIYTAVPDPEDSNTAACPLESESDEEVP